MTPTERNYELQYVREFYVFYSALITCNYGCAHAHLLDDDLNQPRPRRFDVLSGCVTHAQESRCVAHNGERFFPNFPFPSSHQSAWATRLDLNCFQSRSPSLRYSGRNVRLWDNPFQGGI